MKLSPKFVLFATLTVAIFTTGLDASVRVGEVAPDFVLDDIAGQPHRLSEYRGKTVVLEWNNPDCPFVRKHYDSDNLPKLQRAAMADGVVWLMINSGAPGRQGGDYTAKALAAWLGKYRSKPTAYLRDAGGQIGHLYAAKTTPQMFVITAEGKVAYSGAIDSIRSTDPEDVAKAVNYVSLALAAIKEGRPVEKPVTSPYGCSVKY